jgi:hypothetical protein
VFSICGGVAILWWLGILIFLPDNILSAKRFSNEDKALLIGRGKIARTGIPIAPSMVPDQGRTLGSPSLDSGLVLAVERNH